MYSLLVDKLHIKHMKNNSIIVGANLSNTLQNISSGVHCIKYARMRVFRDLHSPV